MQLTGCPATVDRDHGEKEEERIQKLTIQCTFMALLHNTNNINIISYS